MEDKRYYLDAVMNNTYSLKDVEDSMNEIITTSFQYLYELQNHNIGYKRFDFKMSELLRTNTINNILTYYPRKYTCYVNENFISENRRLMFKRSKFYNQEISFYDTIENHDIFAFSFVLFVDGLFFLDGVNILCKEDTTYFIFNIKEKDDQIGIPKDKFDQLLEKDADITVFFIPNGPKGSITTNKYVLDKYREDGLPLAKFCPNTRFNVADKFLTFGSNNTQEGGVLLQSEVKDRKLLLDTTNLSRYVQYPTLDIHLFNFRYVLEIKKVRGEGNFFQIDQQETPVPVENVMIFGTHGEYKHNIKLKLYYPNVYEVIGREGDEPLDIYFFYYDDTVSELHEYRNELAVYYKYTKNVLDKYKDGSIIEIIRDYMPQPIDYSINDFKDSNDEFGRNHFMYKNETLRDLINIDPNHFSSYLRRQVSKANGYYIDISKLDLTSKLRYNNKDVDKGAFFEIFDEPRYMFVFRNEYVDTFMNLTWFIDGQLYTPDKYYRNDIFEFYYIPTALIRHSSIIEIEKMDEFHREYRCKFDVVDEVKEFSLNKRVNMEVFHNDVFLTIEDGTIVDPSSYKVIVNVDEEEYAIEEDSFFIINDTFKVQLTDPDLVGVELRVNIKKNCRKQNWNVDIGYTPAFKVLKDSEGNKYSLNVTNDRTIYLEPIKSDVEAEDYIHLISENELDWACYIDDDNQLKMRRLKPDILLSTNECTYKLGVDEEKNLYIEKIESSYYRDILIIDINEDVYRLGLDAENLYIHQVLEDVEIVSKLVGKHVISDNMVDFILTVEDGLLCMEEIPPHYRIEEPVLSETFMSDAYKRFMLYASNVGEISLRRVASLDGMDAYLAGAIEFTIDMKKDTRHLRVYRNGKVIPPSFYEVKWSNKLQDPNRLYLYQLRAPGDLYTIECLPYKMKEVAFIRELPESGFVDLGGKADKPLDLKWFDIFLNGNKLNRDQIEIISATKFFVKNVSSNMNLSVIEIDRDPEYFGFKDAKDIMDKIWEYDEEFRVNVDDAIPDIVTTEDDVINQEVSRMTSQLEEFWKNFLRYFGYINPDTNQIPDEVKMEYIDLFIDNICLLEPDNGGDNDEALNVYLVNPDMKPR